MRDPNRIFISTCETAKVLGVSRITVWNKIEQGKLRATKVGHAFMIRRDDLTKVVETLIVRRTNKRRTDDILRDLRRIS